MRYLNVVPLLVGLMLVGVGRAEASPIFEDDENGSGLLRVANQPDQGISQASIRLGSSGKFHLTTEGNAPQDFRGVWNNTAPGVYDLQVNQGFGQWGATGDGRLIENDGELQEFELAGTSSGEPFYISFGTGGYSAPYPASDGFALSLSLGGGYGYFYGTPSYYNYGHFSDGHNHGYWNGGPGRAYSDYPGTHGNVQLGVHIFAGGGQPGNRPNIQFRDHQFGGQPFQGQRQDNRGAQFNQPQQFNQPRQDNRATQFNQPQQFNQPRQDNRGQQFNQPQPARQDNRGSQGAPQRQASQQPQHRAVAGYGSGGH